MDFFVLGQPHLDAAKAGCVAAFAEERDYRVVRPHSAGEHVEAFVGQAKAVLVRYQLVVSGGQLLGVPRPSARVGLRSEITGDQLLDDGEAVVLLDDRLDLRDVVA
jgi:hypothetical protein